MEFSMSSSLTREAGGGFVRIPRSYISLPVSPGAKVVLLHLCAAADQAGESWYSFEDIAEIVGRSKASISAYVAELVDHGIVGRIRQTMANGYNYRVKLRIIGWSDLLAHWSSLTRRTRAAAPREACPPAPIEPDVVPVAECSVQPGECQDPTGLQNKIPQTETPPPAEPAWSEENEEDWKRFRLCDRDPITQAGPLPSPETAERLERHLRFLEARAGLVGPGEMTALAQAELAGFCRSRNLTVSAEHLAMAADALAGLCRSRNALDAALAALASSWKPYWRKLSQPNQIRATCLEAAEAADPPAALVGPVLLFRNRRHALDFQRRIRARRS